MCWQKKRRQVVRMKGNVCLYCNEPQLPSTISIDHVLPKHLGGTNHISNLAVSCKWCNRLKGSLLLTSFIELYGIKITKKIARYL